MQFLKADQIIAAIIGWTEHNTVTCFRQLVRRFNEARRWNSRTIGIDQADRLTTDGKRVFRRKNKSFTKLVATLWNKEKVSGQNVLIRRLGANWRVNSNTLC